MKTLVSAVVLALVIAFAGGPASGQEKPAEDITLTVCWASWQPANLLEELAKGFTAETGIKVKGLFVPWGQFQDKVVTEMAAKSPAIDLVVLDSQWLGWMVGGGHLVELTDWLENRSTIDLNDYYEATLKAYGEYPPGSNRMYAVTCEQDLEGLVYRKDLFQDPDEQEAFRAKYGRELAAPETWDELRDIAEFFNRPDRNLYGFATKWSRDYDVVTWDFAQVLWSFGGQFWDPKTRRVDGLINSPQAVQALRFYKGLVDFAPPGAANFSFDEVNTEMQQGRVAMAIQWFAFFEGFISKTDSPTWDKVAFAAVPAGPKGRFSALGGQGIGVTAYSEHREAALKFIDWFQSDETQWAWAKGGGLTGRKSIVNDPKFLDLKPYYAAFRDSLPHARDIWNIPEYAKLLDVTQKDLNAAVSGKMDPKAALDDIAEKHEQILGSRAARPEGATGSQPAPAEEGSGPSLLALVGAAAVIIVLLLIARSKKAAPVEVSPPTEDAPPPAPGDGAGAEPPEEE